jgi:hypothetical protein
MLPELITFAPERTGKTPTRGLTRMVQRGEAPLEVEQRVNNCFGVLVKALPPHQQRCELCKKKTSWQCVLCRRWLCADRKGLSDSRDNELYQQSDKGKTVTFKKMCFHKAHQTLWDRVSQSGTVNALAVATNHTTTGTH